MTKTEIKKALYREKPKAKELGIFGDVGKMFWVYRTKLSSGGVVYFEIPEEERTWNTTNSYDISAQLLIRWMV